MATPALSLTDIALKKSERGLLLGGTGTGKSTAAEFLIPTFAQENPRARILVMDSKPRFKAQYEMTGLSADRRYRSWDHGAKLANSMLLTSGAAPNDILNSCWRHGRVALCQTSSRQEIGWAVSVLTAFLSQARAGRPQLVYIDEGLDFFHANSVSRGGDDAILRVARAGRERGVSLLLASQRPRGIPVQILSEMTKLYMFRLDFAADIKYLGEMGYPYQEFPSPSQDFVFRFWDKKHRENAPEMKLKVGK